MAGQPGARTQVAFAFESVYGTPPASGYRRMPFATTTLGSEQGLLSPELLGYPKLAVGRWWRPLSQAGSRWRRGR